jgi:hypothetical protein
MGRERYGKKTIFGVNKTAYYFCVPAKRETQEYDDNETYKAHKETSLGKVCVVMYVTI